MIVNELICFIASLFYMLPLIALLYVPIFVITSIILMRHIHGIKKVRAALIVMLGSLGIIMIIGLPIIAFMCYDCHFYTRKPFLYATAQLIFFTMLITYVQIIIMKKYIGDNRARWTLIFANCITGIIILVGYYLFFVVG